MLAIHTTQHSHQQTPLTSHRAALKHHPDRVPLESPERPARTKRFQAINDAYYTLSDATRRRDYDSARAFHTPSSDSDTNSSTSSGGGGWSSFFGGGAKPAQTEEQFSNSQFGSAFEEMMREQGMASEADNTPTGKFWSLVGGLSGGAMGFIVANFPGAVAGAVAGNRLGAIRDRRGMSVYSVFQELDQGDRARLLSQLAAKVFASAVSG